MNDKYQTLIKCDKFNQIQKGFDYLNNNKTAKYWPWRDHHDQSTNCQASSLYESHLRNASTPKQEPDENKTRYLWCYIRWPDKDTSRRKSGYKQGYQHVLTTSPIYTRAMSSSKQPRFFNKE